MAKVSTSIGFDSLECLNAAENYLRCMMELKESVEGITITDRELNLFYRPDAEDFVTAQIEAMVVGFRDGWMAINEDRERLRAAISKHRAQKADDRCIEDDDELYATLGDGIPCDRRVGDKIAMLHNCARFIERRCEGGGWPSYVELEADRNEMRRQRDELSEEMETCHRMLDQHYGEPMDTVALETLEGRIKKLLKEIAPAS